MNTESIRVIDQELEDAANNWIDLHYNKGVEYSKSKRGAANPKSGFIAGAKWQKEQSATDAMEFAEWCSSTHYRYDPIYKTWRYDADSYTSKEFYKLWQQSKNK